LGNRKSVALRPRRQLPREDSRIRHNPGVFARLRSFAPNILGFNGVENVSDARYRIALGGLDALRSLRFM
jgi:tRNA (Thr-GGU) A37 N-methylase